jgi:hypothetical protein
MISPNGAPYTLDAGRCRLVGNFRPNFYAGANECQYAIGRCVTFLSYRDVANSDNNINWTVQDNAEVDQIEIGGLRVRPTNTTSSDGYMFASEAGTITAPIPGISNWFCRNKLW